MEFEQLYKNYSGFEIPQIKLEEEGEDLLEDGVEVEDARIEMSSSYKAQNADITLKISIDEMNYKNYIARHLKMGNTLKISLGYDTKLKEVFIGYIHSLAYKTAYRTREVFVRVLCLDCKGIMMNTGSFFAEEGKDLEHLINEIADKSGYRKLIKKKSIDPIDEMSGKPLPVIYGSDYEFLCEQAERLGFDFYFLRDEMIFGSPKEQQKADFRLSCGSGIRELELETSMTGQLSSLLAVGMDESGKRLQFRKERCKGSRPGERDMIKHLNSCERTIVINQTASIKLLKKKAEAYMRKAERAYAVAQMECIGIPELLTGTCIELSESDLPALDGRYSVTRAVHSFENKEYYCTITAEKE